MDTMTELDKELALLRSRCKYLEVENLQKDRDILELKKAHKSLQEIKRSASVHSFHPTMALDALPQEFEAVKKGLRETTEKCQQLLSHLDLITQAKVPEEVKNRDFQTQTSVPGGLEEHATGLKVSLNELHRKLDDWRLSHIFHTQAVQHETFQDAVACFHALQNENDLVRNENQSLNQKVRELREIIENLTSVHASQDAEAKEHIQVLKHQTLTYSEDFANERRDREAAQRQVADLEAQVSSMRKVIQSYESKQMDDIRHRREEALERYRREYQENRSSHPSLYQTDSQPEFDAEMGEDTVDSGSASKPASIKEATEGPLNSA